ncbi:nitroreductase-like protein [Novymonas esmeraldas]|uniref:Nitroreductase-like protein n=1 Tax=Novymonas esmeraldas TaxID=1808958 RepID=A0AAW0EQJ5_9TRYP
MLCGSRTLRAVSETAATVTARSGSGAFAAVRRLLAWNRTNAAAASAVPPSSSSSSPPNASSAAATTLARDAAPTGAGASSTALDVVEAAVRERWTCRQFDPDRPISLDTLRRVLAATTRAPTGFNLQGWHAVVVTDAARREQLYKAALGQPQVLQAPVTVIFVADAEPERNAAQVLEMGLESGYYNPLYGAAYLRHVYYLLHGGPMQSMAAVKSYVSAAYSRAAGTPLLSVPVTRAGYAWKQTMMPATSFVQLCTAAGWNTCIMEGIDEEAVKRVIGVPAGTARYTVPVIVSVGYATAAEATRRREVPSPRLATAHLVRWNRF